MYRKLAFALCFVFFATVFSVAGFAVLTDTAQAAPLNSTYCGALGEYTSLYKNKATLWVWKNGGGKPNPTNMVVKYNGRVLSTNIVNTANPWFDSGNGWVGYGISSGWALTNPGWIIDSRWDVSGCVAK